jgi:hypothetical protein
VQHDYLGGSKDTKKRDDADNMAGEILGLIELVG